MTIPEEETRKYFGEITEEPESIDFSKFPKWITDIINDYSELWCDKKEFEKFLSWANISEEEYHNLEFTKFAKLINQYKKPDMLPMFNGNMYNAIFKASRNDESFEFEPMGDIATLKTSSKQGATVFQLLDYSRTFLHTKNKNGGILRASAQKLLDIAVCNLTANNYFRGDKVYPVIEINVDEYALDCGENFSPETNDPKDIERAAERRKKFIQKMRSDLNEIEHISWTGSEMRGNKRNDYDSYRIVSSSQYWNGVYTINFDMCMAQYLTNSYASYFPRCLLRHDNRHPYSYALGRKIAFHNCMDNNAKAGTNNSLKISTLLASTPDIMDIETVLETDATHWKKHIKSKIETGLNDNVAVGLLTKWEYRDAHGETYNSKQADKLTIHQYAALTVDFIMKSEIDQSQRRSKKNELTENNPPKKRGRPPKNN